MNWFFAAGDSPYFFSDQLRLLSFLPQLWRGEYGFGMTTLPLLWVDYPLRVVTGLLYHMGFSWFLIDKILWLSVFLMAIFGSYRLAKKVGLSKKLAGISSLIYSTNTYILLLFDGGQLGVACAYGFAPYVFSIVLQYIQIRSNPVKLSESIFVGIALSILLFLDIRLFYVFLSAVFISVGVLFYRKQLRISKHSLIIPIIIVGMNLFWILPSIQYHASLSKIMSQNTDSTTGLAFFSVADFSHSMSLLHPNYPDNLFGHVSFLKPEFLLLPVLAFGVLLWKDTSLLVVTFGTIGLLGAFLSKGVHDPLGDIYSLLYRFLPGFFLFRDPTKWYLLTALSYSMLIPQALFYFSKALKRGKIIVPVLFIAVWLYMLRFLFLGTVAGNVRPPKMSTDYELLRKLLLNDQSHGRTVWLPTVERFGYASDIHPAMAASELLTESSPAGILRLLQETETQTVLKEAGVSYLIVPEDIQKRIFLDDYKYRDELRRNLIAQLDSDSIFQKIPGFTRLAVYKVPNSYSSFFFLNTNPIKATPYSPQDQWILSLPDRRETATLASLLSYDPNWRLEMGDMSFSPRLLNNKLMVFSLPKGEKSQATLKYLPAGLARAGAIISAIILLSFSVTGIALRRRGK